MLIHEAVRQAVGLGQPLRVLDLCAAPGGKSTLLLSAIGEAGFLLSNEVIQSRVSPLKMNLEKWGHVNSAVSNHDPADFEKLAGFFDVVLVDAPCSGEGLFRKDDEAASHWSPESVEHCAVRQQRILAEASQLIKQGGVLIYSTCTFNSSENENNVSGLIGTGEFEHVPLDLPATWGVTEKKLGYQCYPHRVRGEGFFFACLRKTGETASPQFKASPPRDWQRIPEKQTGIFRDWISQAADYEYFTRPEGTVVAVAKQHLEVSFAIGSALKKRSVGIEIGELKKQDLVPSHTLALANCLSPHLPKAQLEKTQALLFLKKENLWQPDWQRGWALASFEGLPIGWLKVLDNRSNNYLPAGWRIRMDL